MKKKQFTISNFYCLSCGNKISLPRARGQQREKHHIKDIYCIHCGKETKHVEKREHDFDFDFTKIQKTITINV